MTPQSKPSSPVDPADRLPADVAVVPHRLGGIYRFGVPVLEDPPRRPAEPPPR